MNFADNEFVEDVSKSSSSSSISAGEEGADKPAAVNLKEESAPPEEESSSTKQQSAATTGDFETKISNRERRDLLADLEHVIAVGNVRRHESWRVQQWKQQEDRLKEMIHETKDKNEDQPKMPEEENPPVQNEQSTAVVSETVDNNQKKRPPRHSSSIVREVHPHDVRIYGLEGFSPDPWPKRKKTLRDIERVPDTAWYDELSDGIHPIAFAATHSSERIPSDPVDCQRLATMDLDPEHTMFDVTGPEAARALLLRCWERAVHGAATCIEVNVGAVEEQQAVDEVSNPELASLPLQAAVAPLPTRSAAEARCRALNITIDIHATKRSCPVCQVEFQSNRRLHDHYYGTDAVRGCCWRAVHEKEIAVLAKTLQADVQAQMVQLVHMVIADSREAAKKLQGKGINKQTLNWRFILGLLENKLASTRRKIALAPEVTKYPVQETVELSRQTIPLILNEHVLQAVKNRVADRYGRVPR